MLGRLPWQNTRARHGVGWQHTCVLTLTLTPLEPATDSTLSSQNTTPGSRGTSSSSGWHDEMPFNKLHLSYLGIFAHSSGDSCCLGRIPALILAKGWD